MDSPHGVLGFFNTPCLSNNRQRFAQVKIKSILSRQFCHFRLSLKGSQSQIDV